MRYKSLLLALLLILMLMTCACADTGVDILLPDALEGVQDGSAPTILYTGKTKTSLNMRSAADKNSESRGVVGENSTVQIFGFDQEWLFCWSDSVGIYFLGRHNVDLIEPTMGVSTPYGVVPNRFVAFTSKDTALYASPSEDADVLIECPENMRMSFWLIQDGWAVVPYRRLVGYIYVGDLKELTPVAPTVDYAQEGDIIAAFTTFYSTRTTELNIGRMENIRVGCAYISKSYAPGEEFDFNTTAGPYRRNRGYMPSPVLIDGGTVSGYGGGTCQVSTTLYNSLLQLYNGITIVYRRPHGPSGATYAPHGVDAAVGATNLNLIFRNDFDFPITIDSSVQDGSLCIVIRKGAV